MRGLIQTIGISGILLFTLVGALATPAPSSADDRGFIVIVFKDGHRQSFAMAEIASIDFKAPAVVVYKDGHKDKIPAADIARIEFESAAVGAMMPGRSHFVGKWEVGDGNGDKFFITSTPTARKGKRSVVRTALGLSSMERPGSAGRMAGMMRFGKSGASTKMLLTSPASPSTRRLPTSPPRGTRCPSRSKRHRVRFGFMRKSQASPEASQIHPLDRSFFSRDPRRVARELLGKVLVREGVPRLTARIVEVEAYLGEEDPAAHAAAGNTARTAVLFGPPGHAYVYFIYGNHYCLNVSCEPEGRAGSVLFRALEPRSGVEEMARARGIELRSPKDTIKLTSGPGKLCEAFAITRARDNACDLTCANSSLWIGEDGYRARHIRTDLRIGIAKAADRPLRYLLEGNPFVSKKVLSKG